MCTFPNLRTEANCKGCGSPIPPGLLFSPAAAEASMAQIPQNPIQQMNAQMNSMSLMSAPNSTGSTMRVHIPNGMLPGQRIKVRAPDGKEVVTAIPPRGEWLMDGSRPFFRVQFGPSETSQHPTPTAHEVPPPHRISWRQFHSRASSAYSPPPLRTTPVPYAPMGSPGVPPNGRHKALIIGINYHGTRAQLRGCINDAKSMQNLLRQNGFPDDGSHMLMLSDERNRGRLSIKLVFFYRRSLNIITQQ